MTKTILALTLAALAGCGAVAPDSTDLYGQWTIAYEAPCAALDGDVITFDLAAVEDSVGDFLGVVVYGFSVDAYAEFQPTEEWDSFEPYNGDGVISARLIKSWLDVDLVQNITLMIGVVPTGSVRSAGVCGGADVDRTTTSTVEKLSD